MINEAVLPVISVGNYATVGRAFTSMLGRSTTEGGGMILTFELVFIDCFAL